MAFELQEDVVNGVAATGTFDDGGQRDNGPPGLAHTAECIRAKGTVEQARRTLSLATDFAQLGEACELATRTKVRLSTVNSR
jgi:hypothetical protein